MTTLNDLLDLLLTVRRVSPAAAVLYRRTLTMFGEHLESAPVIGDLTDETVSRWIAHLERSLSQWTIAGHRTRILALWRFAARRDPDMPMPREVRRAPPPEPMPEAWTTDEMQRLLVACKQVREGKAYFKALILCGYESGLRRGDLVRLERSQISQDGTIARRMSKTSTPHYVRVQASTAALVLALPGWCPLAIPWGSKKYTRLWQELRKLAGVSEGGLQKLRRTGATYVARDYGIDAARDFLGHRTDSMYKHYVDRRIAAREIKQPPRLTG